MRIDESILTNIVNSSSSILRKGFLWKRGAKSKTFLRRWFVLKCNILFYFEKMSDKKPLGVIILEGVTIKQSTGNGSYCIEISSEDVDTRAYVLETSSKSEMELWMDALNNSSYYMVKKQYEELSKKYEILVKRKIDKEKHTLNKEGLTIATETIVTKL